MSDSKRLLLDLGMSGSVPFLGVWLYEISNLIALGAQGYSVSISTAGWLPLGVAGTSTGGLSPLTKVFQMAIALSLIAPLGTVFSKTRLLVAETFVVSTAGIYLVSGYWEMLSMLTSVPMAIHMGIFLLGTSVIVLVLLRQFRLPRYLRNTSSPASTGQPTLHRAA